MVAHRNSSSSLTIPLPPLPPFLPSLTTHAPAPAWPRHWLRLAFLFGGRAHNKKNVQVAECVQRTQLWHTLRAAIVVVVLALIVVVVAAIVAVIVVVIVIVVASPSAAACYCLFPLFLPCR